MSIIHSFLSGLNIGAANGWDVFILAVILVALFIWAYSLGRNRLVIIILSSYFSLSILGAMPWKKISKWGFLGISGQGPSVSTEIIIFFSLILAFYLLIPRSILSSTLRVKGRGNARWWQLFILGVVQMGLMGAIILSYLPPEETSRLTPGIKKVFIGSGPWFVWMTLPILAMVFTKRPRKVE